ncbi:MAG: CopG family transcriptional regulator [Candidatus Poribacteria bacterium]
MKTQTSKKIPTADEIADMADRGENVTKYFQKGKMMPPLSRDREDVQRVNVDFTYDMLGDLDAEARRLNISRQAVIKTMLADALDRRLRLRNKKQAS